jgi:predicted Zn-dependent protease with MMP-like domain
MSAGDDDIDGMDDRSFDALEDRVERLAKAGEQALADHPGRDLPPGAPIASGDDFEAAVRSALDALPTDVIAQLRGVAVTVSDDGAEHHAYGMFIPGATSSSRVAQWFPWGAGGNDAPDQIVIYRDTLTRDFGHDQALLRDKITQTVRHEVGHLIGFDEDGVRGLGL